MADISAELAAIKSAVYGEEVRDSIHDGLYKMNSDLNTAIGRQVIDRATIDNIIESNALLVSAGDEVTMIPDYADINTYTTPGTYKVTNPTHAGTMTNLPSAIPGKLIVMATSQTARVTQFYVGMASAAPVYARAYNGSTWGAWDSFAKSTVVNDMRDRVSDLESSDFVTMDDVKNEALLVTAGNEVTMIPDYADINTYTTPGTYKVTNPTHAGTMTNLPSTIPGKLIVMATSQTARVTQFYVGMASAAPVYARAYNGSTWGAWDSFAKSTVVNDIRDRVSAIEGLVSSKSYVKYASGSFDDGKAVESISIYLPATSGYILYVMYHYIDGSSDQNYNVWRIYHVYHVDNLSNANQKDLSISGEWECAIHLSGRDDFSGGSTHGDEIMSGSPVILIDGAPTDISSITGLVEFNELCFIRLSNLYDPANHTSIIAEHGTQYLFKKGSLEINQSILWKVSESLTNCFLAMFLPSKNVLDRAIANSDFKVLTLPSTTSERLTTITKSNASAVTMWDTGGGMYAKVSVPVYPTGLSGGDTISISDNSGKSYNKVYFKICGGGTSQINELWKSKSIYEIDYA